MRSTSAGRSEPVEGAGRLYDGETARAHAVRLGLSPDRQSLAITGETLPAPLHWRLADLRAVGDERPRRDRLTLSRHMDTADEAPRDPARLVIEDAGLIAAIRASRPNLARRDLHRGTLRRVLLYAGGAVAAVLVMLFVILPSMADTLARIIPMEREVAFGKSVMGQLEGMLGGRDLGALHCDAPAGRAALDALEARLTDGQSLEYEIEITVFDHPMLNAFAAPGGQVVLMRGLIEKARGPDEVAGVLAHEIGHVVSRDPTRNALRATGSAGILSLVLGDFTGGAIFVALGEAMMNASYTRAAEAAADAYALGLLGAADISTRGFADFFDTLRRERGQGAAAHDLEERAEEERSGYLATHPASGGRAALARDFAETQQGTRPALDDARWQALRNICSDDP